MGKLTPALLEKASKAADVQRKMMADVKDSADETGLFYIATKEFTIGGEGIPLFILTASSSHVGDFIKIIKAQDGAPVGKGTCDVITDGTARKVVFDNGGGLNDQLVMQIIKKVAKIAGITKAEEEKARKSKAREMADKSHAVARMEGKLDWKFKPTTSAVKALDDASQEWNEFKKFKGNFMKFLSDNGLPKDENPSTIWKKLLRGLVASGYVKDAIPKAADQTSFILGLEGTDGKVVREKLLAQAMAGLEPFIKHAGKYLDKVATAASGKTWAFWSGAGALDSAKASGGISLEGTVGSFFDKYENEYTNFPKLTGVEDMAIWTAMSEMYAEKAAAHMAKFKIIGFVGPGATRDQSVFNKIEQPVFIEVLTVKMKATPPDIEWYVVDCEKNSTDKWEWTKKAPKKFGDRTAALNEVKRRYGS